MHMTKLNVEKHITNLQKKKNYIFMIYLISLYNKNEKCVHNFLYPLMRPFFFLYYTDIL